MIVYLKSATRQQQSQLQITDTLNKLLESLVITQVTYQSAVICVPPSFPVTVRTSHLRVAAALPAEPAAGSACPRLSPFRA